MRTNARARKKDRRHGQDFFSNLATLIMPTV